MAPTSVEIIIGITILAAAIGIGGGLYEFIVIDPAWPRRPTLVQPVHGGVSRKRFWIPAHIAFEAGMPPIADVKRRVCQHVIGFEVGVLIVEE